MTRFSVLTYAVLAAAVVFAVFSLTDGSNDKSATMAPDLHFRR
jgi:hypothetical protein